MTDQPAQRLVDSAALATGALTGVSWTLAEVNYLVSIGAGCIAMLTGLAALAWYLIKIRRALREFEDQ